MSKKGVSLEEKRQRTIQFLTETKSFYQLKELEKILPKEKGITSQSVKDVVMGLVSDGLIDSDKAGVSVYFWSFPSEGFKKRNLLLEKLKSESNGIETSLNKVSNEVAERETSDSNQQEISQIMREIENLNEAASDINKKLVEVENQQCDSHKNLQKDLKTARQSANRWVDNIFSIKTWAREKFNIEETTLNKSFSIPADLDYV